VLHTDDLAWNHGVFSWDELLINEVLPVLRERRALRYRPPAWLAHGRDGAITLGSNRDFMIIEGVGASQSSVRPELDATIWLETPQSVRESRDASRIAAGETSAASYARWMAEENAYLAAERPWEYADLVVGGGGLDDDQETKIIFRIPNRPASGQHPT
jgi:uridine kinase